MKTIAFVTRVHPKRPGMLKICVNSVKVQTNDDYIHVLYRDDKTESGYGKHMANKSLEKIESIDARYAMILDDDDNLIDSNFVKVFKEAVNKSNPEIVFFKGIIIGRAPYPRPEIWGKAPIKRKIASFCFAVRLDVWKEHIHEFGERRNGGDWCFIFACYKNTKNHLWLNRIVAETQNRLSNGKGEPKYA